MPVRGRQTVPEPGPDLEEVLRSGAVRCPRTIRRDCDFAKAWLLRDRVTDRERFYIDFTYDRQVTGNLERAYKTLEMWSQTYPRRGAMITNAQDLLGGIATQGTGRFERTMEAALDGNVNLSAGLSEEKGALKS